MKAAVFYKPKEPLEVKEIKRPEITSQEVLVRIKTCGICRGDVQRIEGLIKVKKTPIILGHEPAGTIAEIGSEVEGFNIGENVALFAVGCGKCYYCQIGKDNLCIEIASGLGLGRDGCFAEYAKVSPRQLIKLPEGVPLESGSVLTASTGTVFHGIKLADVGAGDTVVIYGTGCLGTQALQLLKIIGAKVIAVDVSEEKIDLAKRLGADAVINARDKEPVKEIKSLTEGRGADVSFEVVGLPKTMEQAINSVRPGGKIVDIGSVMEPINLKMMPFIDEGLSLNKELTLMTVSHCTQKDMVNLIKIIRTGKIDFKLGTLKVPLEEINQGFEIKKGGQYLRVLITP